VYDSASDSNSRIAKTKLHNFAEALGHQAPDVARIIGRIEANCSKSDMQPLKEDLINVLLQWRTDQG